MEDTEKNQPSFPANYVSLADLQQLWLNQQKQKTEKEETLISKEPQKSYLSRRRERKKQQPMRENEKFQQKQQQQRKTETKEPQKSYLSMQDDVDKNVNPKPQFQEPRNPKFKTRTQFRRNYRNRKGPKESKIEGTVTIGVEIDGRCYPVDDLRVKDEKKVPKSEPLEIEATVALGVEMDGPDRPVKDLRVRVEKKTEKKVPRLEPWKIDATVAEKMKPDGQDQIGIEEKIKDAKKKKWKKNKKVQISVPEKQNPALANDRTADIGQKFEKLSVNGRWTAGIEGSRRANRSYGRVSRVMERKWRDNGLIWVKKEDVADHNVV